MIEVTTFKGKEVQLMPWLASDCPYDRTKYERIVRPLKTPTRKGARCEILIVRKQNLKTVRVNVI